MISAEDADDVCKSICVLIEIDVSTQRSLVNITCCIMILEQGLVIQQPF